MAGIKVIPNDLKQPKGKAFSILFSITHHTNIIPRKQEVLMPRTMNPKPKSNTKRVTIHLTHDTVKNLEKLAAIKGWNVSQVIRRAIDDHLKVKEYNEDTELLSGIIRREVKEQIEKQANRLASMLFKVGIISSSNYFLAVRTLSDVISPSMQEDFKDINANARKLGIDYMKQSGVGVIEFLEDSERVEQAAEKLKTEYTMKYED
jgi:hypothetical protein